MTTDLSVLKVKGIGRVWLFRAVDWFGSVDSAQRIATTFAFFVLFIAIVWWKPPVLAL